MSRYSMVLAASAVVVASACGNDVNYDNADFDTSGAHQSALYGGGSISTLWNNNSLGTAVIIPVCFSTRPVKVDSTFWCRPAVNRTTDCLGRTIPVDDAHLAIRKNNENAWQTYANVEFIGWGDCDITNASASEIAAGAPAQYVNAAAISGIIIMPDEPENHSVQDHVDGKVGIDVAFGVGKASGRASLLSTNMQIEPQSQQLVPAAWPFNSIHELGHVLGFTHEWVRPDYVVPSGCTVQEAQQAGGALLSFFPDYDSIMDKCGPTLSPVRLSGGDVVGLHKAYGRKLTGSIVGDRGQCIDISGANTSPDAPIVAFPCRNQWNQRFVRSSSTSERFVASAPGGTQRCLKTLNGQLVAATCSSTDSAQRFKMSRVHWRGMGNMCLQAVNGTSIEIRFCKNGNINDLNDATEQNQLWEMFDGTSSTSLRFDQIRSVGANKCVSVVSGAFGEELTLAACSSTDTKQRFAFPGEGIVAYPPTGLCLNTKDGISLEGKRVILWNGCNDTPRRYNEQFTAQGEIRTGSGQCIDLLGGNSNPFDPIGTFSCSADGRQWNQQWEYYF